MSTKRILRPRHRPADCPRGVAPDPDPAESEALWARLDRELTDRAICLPTVDGKKTDVVSRRVGNYQNHPFWGVLVDQLWVR